MEALEASGKFSVSGWKDKIYGGNTSLVMFGKGGETFLSEKCQFYDQNNSQKSINCPELLYTVFPFFSPKELKYILLNLLTLGCFVWWYPFVKAQH